MAYVLPRGTIILMAWGMTSILIWNLWPEAQSAAFLIAGASWAMLGLACFGYVRKLRRNNDLGRQRS